MLSAIALGRVGFGLVLVLVFSLGLAGVLTAIGLLFIYARRFLNRYPTHSKFINVLPAASALLIAIIGAGIVARALMALGLINV